MSAGKAENNVAIIMITSHFFDCSYREKIPRYCCVVKVRL
jgi:hypothetical protein